jgi:hypothetical protein
VCAAVTLIVSAVLRLLTPPAPTTPLSAELLQSVDGGRSRFNILSFDGTPPTVAAQLRLFSLKSDVSRQDLIQMIVERHSMSEIKKGVHYEGGGYSLFAFGTTTPMTLALTILEKPKSATNKQDAIDAAKVFVNEQLGITQLIPLESEVVAATYGESGDVYENDEEIRLKLPSPSPAPNKSESYRIPMSYIVDGFPVLVGADAAPPITVVIQDNRAVKLTFSNTFFSFEPINPPAPTITVDAALLQLKAGMGSITAVNAREQFGELSLAQIQSATFHTAQLVYRANHEMRIIAPFYDLTGDAVLDSGERLSITATTPATAAALAGNE